MSVYNKALQKGKLQLAQNRAAQLALKCTWRANINNMHVNPSWLKVEERLTLSLLVFVRSVDKLNAPSCLFKLLAYSSDTHPYPTQHATRDLSTIPKSRTDYGRRTGLCRALATWNSIPHQVTDANSSIGIKKQIKIHPTQAQTHDKTHSTHTYTWMLYFTYN